MEIEEEISSTEELSEQKRPPYKCGHMMSLQRKEEKDSTLFQSARTSFEMLLLVLENYQDEYDGIPTLLDLLKNLEVYSNSIKSGKDERQYPLIILGGFHDSAKSVIGEILAEKINAELISIPPRCISSLKNSFEKGPAHFKMVYDYLSYYVAQVEIMQTLKEKPVIVENFWHFTTAYTLARMKQTYFKYFKRTEIPPKGDDVYKWPQDLIKPDLVFYLKPSENVPNNDVPEEKEQASEEFTKYFEEALDNMTDPVVQSINENMDVENILQEIESQLENFLQTMPHSSV